MIEVGKTYGLQIGGKVLPVEIEEITNRNDHVFYHYKKDNLSGLSGNEKQFIEYKRDKYSVEPTWRKDMINESHYDNEGCLVNKYVK